MRDFTMRQDFTLPILIALLVEALVVLGFFAAVILWCAIGAGRI